MKTLIIAINSKYIHASLAPWYLKACCGNECGNVDIVEYTINDNMDSVLGRIFALKPDVAAFSCYIWNIEYILKLAHDLKKVMPDITIVLGGPEVSYDGDTVLNNEYYVDYILSGEGEFNFKQLITYLYNESISLKDIKGLAYRYNETAIVNPGCAIVENLDSIPTPYTDEMFEALGNRIVYYESSRGCPFSCSYCLSSITKGVRFFSMDRVRRDLDKLVNSGVRQIKFVDRTFNSNKDRAKEIFRIIIKKYSDRDINFHFEVAGDLFDEEMFSILSHAAVGLIQFEIGVQTTNERTLELINRKTSTDKVFNNSKKLKELDNTHLHLDLIAGLPEESYKSFKNSFNEVYSLKPHQLQLGFLKMLKGSSIRAEADKHGYKYRHYAPYEVLENKYITFEEMREIKGVEEMVERYYNSRRFISTLEYLHKTVFPNPYDFYFWFYEYNRAIGAMERGVSSRELYSVLFDYIKGVVPEDQFMLYNELLKFDFLCSDNTNNLPYVLHRHIERGFKERCFEFIKCQDNVEKHIPQFTGVPAKQIIKRVHFEKFMCNVVHKSGGSDIEKEEIVVLFDYSNRDRATGVYRSQIIDLD